MLAILLWDISFIEGAAGSRRGFAKAMDTWYEEHQRQWPSSLQAAAGKLCLFFDSFKPSTIPEMR